MSDKNKNRPIKSFPSTADGNTDAKSVSLSTAPILWFFDLKYVKLSVNLPGDTFKQDCDVIK